MASSLLRQESESLTHFLDSVSHLKPLDFATEQRLAKIISESPKDSDGIPRSGEAAAAVDMLVAHNLRFAVFSAQRMGEVGLPLDDLVSAAYIGLYKAATKFRPGFGAKFIAYATHRMKSEMQITVSYNSGAFSHPAHTASNLAKYLKFRAEKEKAGQRPDDFTAQEFADWSGLSLKLSEAVISFAGRMRARETFAGGYGEDKYGSPRYEPWDLPAIEHAQENPIMEMAKERDTRRLLDMMMEGMTPAQRRAVERVYLDGIMPAALARDEGTSRQAIDCRLRKALLYMRRRHERLVAMGKIER